MIEAGRSTARTGFRVPARSIAEIRQRADHARQVLGIPEGRFDLELFLESLTLHGIDFDVIDDDDDTMFSTNIEACCVPEELTIYIRESVYQAARTGRPREYFTVMHEIGHLVLAHRRVFHRERGQIQRYEDSEWQADQFAAELLMPLDVIRKRRLSTATDIAEFFGVSQHAAQRREAQLTRRGEM